MILVDTNVLIDISARDPVLRRRSSEALADALTTDIVAINDVIFSEFSAGYQSAAACAAYLQTLGIRRETIPDDALHLAAEVFRAYRRRGGTRTGTLPDFFIGAHAQIAGAQLLTGDTGRYGTYFPTVALRTP